MPRVRTTADAVVAAPHNHIARKAAARILEGSA